MSSQLPAKSGVIAQPAPSEFHQETPPEMWRALLVSALLHTVLILVLALIAVQVQRESPHELAFVRDDSRLDSLTSLPEFTVAPAPQADQVVQVEPDLSSTLAMELPTIQNLSPIASLKEEEDAADFDQGIADDAKPGAPASTVAVSIQKRVYQAGGKKGEVQFALAWKNVNDVDLHVITPSGERISHLYRRSACNGMLDVDMNVKAESTEPVENVRWIRGAPAGRYTVLVHLFRIHRAPIGGRVYQGSRFQLLSQLGDETLVREETVSRRQQLAVFRFQYVPASASPEQRAEMTAALEELQTREEAAAGPALEAASATRSQTLRERMLNNVIIRYPHTDAAIEAMRLLGGNITKR